MNISLTNNAAEFLRRKLMSFDDNYGVRVFIKSKGCCSLDLGIAIDTEKSSDIVYDEKGISFLIDKKMAKYIKGFKVDYMNSFLGGKLIIEDMYKSTC